MAAREIAIVVFADFQLLDLSGPADVLRTATLLGARPGYDVVIASPDGRPVTSVSGICVTPHHSLEVLARQRRELDCLLVVGGFGVERLLEDEAILGQLRRISKRARRTASVCTGAKALAAAGLLDGYQATTHWSACDALSVGYPSIEVLADRIFVHDRDRWTSAGVTAGIDLALALVEDDVGTEVAHAVAQWLVVFVRRPGGQAQFSAQLRLQPARSPVLTELQRWLPDHLDENLAVEVLARRTGMSMRNFSRTFRRELGITPASFVESLRLEAARRLLETTDLTVATVAVKVGFRHAETMHRVFGRRLGTTPDRYRQHFRRRAS